MLKSKRVLTVLLVLAMAAAAMAIYQIPGVPQAAIAERDVPWQRLPASFQPVAPQAGSLCHGRASLAGRLRPVTLCPLTSFPA